MKSVTIFGGSFDPIHYAHLIIAQDIIEKIKTQKILFLPSLYPPHKRVFAPFTDRVNMVALAIRGNSEFQYTDIEERITKPSYSIKILREIKDKFSVSKLSFVIGMDSAVEFSTWKDPDKLLGEFEIVVVPRPGYRKRDILPRYRKRMSLIDTRQLEISSTEIRKRIRRGRSIKYLTPDSVITYIDKKKLYK